MNATGSVLFACVAPNCASKETNCIDMLWVCWMKLTPVHVPVALHVSVLEFCFASTSIVLENVHKFGNIIQSDAKWALFTVH